MFSRLLLPMITIALLGCSKQNGAPRAAAPDQLVATQPMTSPAPAAPLESASPPSPVVSAEPALDREPGEPVAARTSAPVEGPARGSDAAEQPAHRVFVIPAGTRIRVRLAQTLDTKYARPCSTFAATLDDPIVVGDHIVVPRGPPFTGAIVASKSSGRFRGRALLEMTLRSFRMNGATYHIATAADTRVSGSHKRRNLAFMGGGPAAGALIGAGVGAAAGATTAFITGKKNVKLPVETPMVFSLRSGVAVRRS